MQENAFKRLKSYAEDIFHNKTKLIRILLVIFILLLALLMRIHESSKADITVENSTEEAVRGEICIDIGGAVVSPGVYKVDSHTRLYEVIELAGGLLSNADTDSINRAEYVEDGEKIIIPSRPIYSIESEESDGTQPDISEPADITSSSESADTAASTASTLVNINYASREELMTLSGIGEAKADRIIEYRSSKKFRKKEDIKSVNGIGDSIYNKIKDSITV